MHWTLSISSNVKKVCGSAYQLDANDLYDTKYLNKLSDIFYK